MNKVSASLLVWVAMLALPARSMGQPASLDSSFNPLLNPGAQVYAVAVQTNGQILIGGIFTSIGGTPVTNIARLNQDGTLDSRFDPLAAADLGYVSAIAVQTDGKVVIGGAFASSAGITPVNLARLNTNGTVDSSFDRSLSIDNAVNAALVQADGKILFGGAFQIVDAVQRRNVARLHPDGTLDVGFDACVASSSGSGATGLALLSDEKILMSGRFTFSVGAFRDGVARLQPNGNLDPVYATPPGVNPRGTVYSLVARADGKAFLGGDFRSFYAMPRGGVVLLTTNGLPDTSFNPGAGINNGAANYALALQSDGKIILAGDFTEYNGQIKYRLARVNPDGSLDATFEAGFGANDSIGAIVLQSDRKILVAGKFSSFNGVPRNGIARLYGDYRTSRLEPPRPLENGQFELTFYGETQIRYALSGSTNLVDWISFTNLTGTGSAMPVVDPTAGPLPRRFYRAVSLP
jgi:uncharacterized delta-60 repeat protein